jgi:hypothetical protein
LKPPSHWTNTPMTAMSFPTSPLYGWVDTPPLTPV